MASSWTSSAVMASSSGGGGNKRRPRGPALKSTAATASSSKAAATARLRDRQACGKHDHAGSDEEEEEEEEEEDDDDDDDDEHQDEGHDDEDGGFGNRPRRFHVGHGIDAEAAAERERRAYALAVLDNPEQLMMFALAENDSIPGQRRRFTAILAGFEPLLIAGAGFNAAAATSSVTTSTSKNPSQALRRDRSRGNNGARSALSHASEAVGEWLF